MKVIGEGAFRYEYQENWGAELAEKATLEWGIRKVSDIGIDAKNNVYILTRSNYPLIITDENGKCIRNIGKGDFVRPHGIFVNKDGYIFIADDESHVLSKFDKDLNLVLEIGERNKPSDTGCVRKDYRTVKHSAGPFNCPTGVCETDDGRIFVSDGYGNARIHVFNKDGKLLYNWGEPGIDPGQFFLPHGIAVAGEIVYVCDRENNRIQLFNLEGTFLKEWNKLIRPASIALGPDGLLYIAECKRCNKFDEYPSRLTIMTPDGEIAARIDNGIGALPFTSYHAAHGIAVDNKGNIYIGEVGDVPEKYLGIKKYCRL